jgi:hypothetical protein
MKHCKFFLFYYIIKIIKVEEPGTKCGLEGIADEGGVEDVVFFNS